MTDRPQGAVVGHSMVAQLEALLAFDHEAALAYRAAAEQLGDESLRRVARHFCDDHERHADELTRLLRAYGGSPSLPGGAESGRASSAIAGLTGDRTILRALKTLARSGRDDYRAAARQALPPAVAAVLRRASNDETTHYAWALEMLDDLDAERGRLRRTVGAALDEGSARLSDFVEVVERRSSSAVDRLREGVYATVGAHPVRAAVVAVGLGLCAATLGRGRTAAP